MILRYRIIVHVRRLKKSVLLVFPVCIAYYKGLCAECTDGINIRLVFIYILRLNVSICNSVFFVLIPANHPSDSRFPPS